MRLLTVHPKYLDAIGLVALWREALLARAVVCVPGSAARPDCGCQRRCSLEHASGAEVSDSRAWYADARRWS